MEATYYALNPWWEESFSQSKNYSEEVAQKIDAEIKKLLQQALRHDLKLLKKHQQLMHSVTKQLIKKETLSQKEFEKILKKEHNKKK